MSNNPKRIFLSRRFSVLGNDSIGSNNHYHGILFVFCSVLVFYFTVSINVWKKRALYLISLLVFNFQESNNEFADTGDDAMLF